MDLVYQLGLGTALHKLDHMHISDAADYCILILTYQFPSTGSVLVYDDSLTRVHTAADIKWAVGPTIAGTITLSISARD